MKLGLKAGLLLHSLLPDHLPPCKNPSLDTMGFATIRRHLSLQLLLPLFAPLLLCQLIHGDSAIEHIAIDCGSETPPQPPDQRLWVADTLNSKLFTLQDQPKNTINNTTNSSKPSRAAQSPQSGNQVPYLTARLSFSPFTYSFSISSGQKFIRLFFYRTDTYSGFENYTPFFSVKAGNGSGFTLLNNFTAEDGPDSMVKEYCVNIKDGEKLEITFIPSLAIPSAYAFINGIEIVSMPTNLYYTDSYENSPKLVSDEISYPINNNSALELMYRINIGGTGVSAQNDTGMYRQWDQDYPYFRSNFPTTPPVDDENQPYFFTMIPNYTAPLVVYKTARSMGPNISVNVNNNLTWTFSVDSGFTYLVRLHFCEFLPTINRTGDRVFNIYVATYLVTKYGADVIGWTGNKGNRIPIYRDYAVLVGNRDGSTETTKENLSIQLHPADVWQTKYQDVILNGVEIFKTSYIDDLAGIHPYRPSTKFNSFSPPDTPPSMSSQSKFAILGGVLAGVLVLAFLVFLLLRRRQKLNKGKNGATSSDGWTSWWDPLASFTPTNKSTKSPNSSLPSGLCRYFSLSEIKAATNNFDEVFIIGVGGFGDVYKGFISSLSAEVAIKRLKQGSEQGATEFKTEIEMLSQLRHLHLVSLIGYCNEDNEMILVYDYMSRGTLRDHLYNTDNPPLSWAQRLEICIGSARGLQYLHSGAKHTIIHRDVKTTNILLDDKWVAKVSDFGLSKIGPNSATKAHISTAVKGSVGYLDPEYYRRQQLTEKSDVYSFGVVLCEVLCARPPINRIQVKKPGSLAEWFRQSYRNGKLIEIIDPYLNGKIAQECLNKYAEVAVRCLADSGADRPSMGDVVWALEFALELQETAKEQVIKMKSSKGSYDQEGDDQSEAESVDLEAPFRLGGSSVGDDNEDLFSVSSGIAVGSAIGGITSTTDSSSEEQSLLSFRSSEMRNSGAVFSEIMKSKGR